MARLPNKGLALKLDLGKRSIGSIHHVRCQILPKCVFEILCCNPIRIIWRWPECNRKIAEYNVEEILEHIVNLSRGPGK